MMTHERLRSGRSEIDLRVATSDQRPSDHHVVVLVHGLPRSAGMGRQAASLLPELAEHLANESGWTVATGTLSGVGTSTGNFSPAQWRDDLAVIIDRLCKDEVWLTLAGFGLGGVLALDAARRDERIRGVATFASAADLESWAVDAPSFAHAVRVAGVISDVTTMTTADELFAELLALDPVGAVGEIPPRRLLFGHGADDPEVPVAQARALVTAADGRAELRIIQGAGHQLRADPRMVATLLGWLDRHR